MSEEKGSAKSKSAKSSKDDSNGAAKAASSTAPNAKPRGSNFGLGIGTMFGDAFKTYAANVVPLSLAAWATFAVYAVFRYPAQQLYVGGQTLQSVGVDLIGLLIAGVVAIPWYHYSLAAVDGRPINFAAAFGNKRYFGYQAVASFWFWAGILLGIRYLFGLPSILVLVLYCFHGFVIVDGAAKGGMLALGQSVRLTEGRRLGLFAIGGLMLVFNLFGAFGIGLENRALGIVVAVIGVTITTSVTMLAGAALYRLCDADLPAQDAPKKVVRRKRKPKSKARQRGGRKGSARGSKKVSGGKAKVKKTPKKGSS